MKTTLEEELIELADVLRDGCDVKDGDIEIKVFKENYDFYWRGKFVLKRPTIASVIGAVCEHIIEEERL